MQNVDWRLLECFRWVGRYEHVSRAAERLGASQPSVSRSIARLEAKLGTRLFDRVGRSVALTDKGRLFLQAIDRAHGEIEAAQAALFGPSEPAAATIALGFLRTLGTHVVPRFVRQFNELYPDARFSFSQNNTTGLEDQLEKGELDLAFTAVPSQRELFAWDRVADQELVLIATRTHRLAREKLVRLRDLSREPFVTFKSGHAVRTLTDQLCQAAGFSPIISFEGDDLSGIPGFVAAGFGLAIVPSDSSLPADVVVLPTAGPLLRRQIGLAWVKGRLMHASAQAFRELVLKECAAVSGSTM